MSLKTFCDGCGEFTGHVESTVGEVTGIRRRLSLLCRGGANGEDLEMDLCAACFEKVRARITSTVGSESTGQDAEVVGAPGLPVPDDFVALIADDQIWSRTVSAAAAVRFARDLAREVRELRALAKSWGLIPRRSDDAAAPDAPAERAEFVPGEAGYRHDSGEAAPECKPKCAFCGRSADRVRLLLTGRIKGSFICDVCILKAMHGLVDKFTVGAEVA